MKKNKKFKKWIVILIVIAIVVAIVALNGNKPEEYRTYTVEKRDIETIISGSGTIAASKSRKGYAKVSAEIENIYFKEGDEVHKGDVILKLDANSYESSIKSQNIAIQQSNLSKNAIEKQISDLKIIANATGHISGLSISEGSYVTTAMPICSIVKNGSYEITLQFVYNANNPILVGNKAIVTMTGNYVTLNGTVSKVSDMKKMVEGNTQVIDVTIEVSTSGYTLEGMTAKGEVFTSTGSIASINQSTFSLVKENIVTAKSTGTVKTLNVSDGSYVIKGDVIAELENSDLSTNLQNINLSLQSQYNQLNLSNDQLDDYTITAEMDGIITYLPYDEGDMISAGTLLATVSNTDKMEFKIPVDELDVAKIDYDKKVNVSIDAIPDTEYNPIEGRVKLIPLEGTTTSGITDYYVTIELPGRDDIRISMSANADIIAQSKKDAIAIPIDAIKSEDDGSMYVEVLEKDEATQKDVISKKTITTGVSDSTYIEVTSGLNIGENVIIPSTSSIHMSTGAMRQMSSFGAQ